MAVGDWPSGAYIVIERGELPELDQGHAGVADVYYHVVLPSGGHVYNGGRVDLAPFHYTANDTLSIVSQGLALVVALAVYEGLDVHLTASVVHPDGTTTP